VQDLLSIAAAILFVILGMFAAFVDPVVHRITVPIEGLSPALEGFRIALLTDLHIGPSVGRSRTARVVVTANSIDAGNATSHAMQDSILQTW
jgi:predicted MPP superfamily phosphohydrolase